MSGLIKQNEATASARSVEINVFDPGTGLGAAPETDLAGYVFISQGTYKYVPAAGATVNKRRTLVVADDVIESVDTGADTATLTGHGYETGDGPFDADEAIGSIAAGDDVYIIVVDENTVAFAANLADAYADNRVALAGTEDGATIADNADTERGIRGKWIHTFTQAETNVTACELSVAILGHDTLEGGASVTLDRSLSSVWDAEMEDGHSYGDGMRVLVRGEAAPYTITGNDYVIRDLADTKDSHHGTITGSGRSGAAIDDPT